MKSPFLVIKKIAKWVLPVLFLIVILTRLDFIELKRTIALSNPFLAVLGLCFFPLQIIVGALRWEKLIEALLRRQVTFALIIRQYWGGLALGVLTPAAIGWDIYRVVAIGKRFGQYLLTSTGIVLEKLVGLWTRLAIAIATYPFITGLVVVDSHLIQNLVKIAYAIMVLVLVGFVLAFLLDREIVFSGMKRYIFNLYQRTMASLGQRLGFERGVLLSLPSLREISRPLRSGKSALMILSLTILGALLAGIRNQIFFGSIHYDIPFLVNLFAVQIFIFVFLMPTPYAGLGVRDALYVLLYGLFGVPIEIAVMVSFYNLVGGLLNTAIGVIILSKSGHG